MFEVKERLVKKALFTQVVNMRISQGGELLFTGPLVRNRRSLRVLMDVLHFQDGFAYKYNCYLTVGEVRWLFQWGDAKDKSFDRQMIKDLVSKGIVPDSDGVLPPLKVELREIYD